MIWVGIRDFILRTGGSVFLERLAKDKSCSQLAERLETDGRGLLEHYAAVGDDSHHRRVLSHIIGIERWGQSRLQVFLGAPLKQEEYDGYRPARETQWDTLQKQFSETRAETVRLARELHEKTDSTRKVLHNMYGPLTARAWLNLLNTHANMESRRLRKS